MVKILYKKSSEPERSVLVSEGEENEVITTTREQNDSISLELGTIITTASDDSIKVKESNTIQSTTKEE